MNSLADTLVDRVGRTLAQAGGRFPVAADPTTGEWSWWSDDGSWTGGFWVAALRLAGLHTGDPRFADAADAAAARLADQATTRTLLRGFLFWYGDAIAPELDAGTMSDSAVRAGAALAADVDAAAGVIPPGEVDSEQYGWPRPGACIDGLPGTVALLSSTGHADVAALHVEGSHRFCVRDDGSVSQDARYDDQGRLTEQIAENGVRPDSTWSRAQAWAMLGFAQAAVRDDRFRPYAGQVTDWWSAHVPSDRVAFWDFDDPAIPDAPRDTSATAIAAAAMLKLGRRDDAAATVEALGRHLGPSGGLVDGCYNRMKHIAVGDELIWGDYFLLEAALGLHHGLDTTRL